MNEKHITRRPITSPWGYLMDALILFPLVSVISRHCTFWVGSLIVLVLIAVVGIASVQLDLALFGQELILSSEGIEGTGRIGRKLVPWSDFIQAGTLTYDETNVLVLVRKGGHILGERTLRQWFIYGNPGKLVFLPDDKLVREFVARYYGPLDFERSEREV